mgnify:CR=1 FL=1
MRSEEREARTFEDHLLFEDYFCSVIRGKMEEHLSGLYNILRKLNTAVSLSCIFQFATPCQMDGGSKR